MLPKGNFCELKSGFKFHYHDSGSGEVVLFLHGSGTGASGYTNFKNNIGSFEDAGFRVVVIDLPGYGFSDKPDNAIYSMEFFNTLILEFLDNLKISKCSIVGNSLGGALAMGLALKRPSLVTKLILMAPGGLEDRDAYDNMPGIRKLMDDFLGGEMNQEKIEGLLRLFPYNSDLVTSDLVEDRMEILPLMNQQVLATMDIPNLCADLKDNNVPVLAFWGANDQFIPLSGIEKITSLFTHAQVIVYSRCGHWVMIERPDDFNQHCINFLQ